MKLQINIEYNSGEQETFVAAPPEWMKWESKTGKTIGDAGNGMGISDLMFLAYARMKREAGGKPVKPYEAWCETISDISVGDLDPKATQ